MSNISQRYSRLIMSPKSGSSVWFISVIKTAFCEHKAIFVSNYNIFQWVRSGGACAAPLHAGWWRAALLGPVQLAGQHAPRDSVGRIWIYARLMTNSKTNQTNEVDVERVEMDICLSVCLSLFSNKRGWCREDSPVCEHLQQQQARQSPPETLRWGPFGLRPPLSAWLPAAFFEDQVKGGA